MAKSKQVTKKTESKVAKQAEAPVAAQPVSASPYQLDPAQVERAAKALVAHMKKHAEEKEVKDGKKNLAADEDEAEENDQPIFLSVSTKQHVNNTNRLKPAKL